MQAAQSTHLTLSTGSSGYKEWRFHRNGQLFSDLATPTELMVIGLHKPKPSLTQKYLKSLLEIPSSSIEDYIRPSVVLHDSVQWQSVGSYLKNFVKFYSFSLDELASYLEVSRKTASNKVRDKKANRTDVERLNRWVRAWTVAYSVFENYDYATEWLKEPNEALAAIPYELLQTSDGERMVLDELGKIAHGIPV